MQKNDRTGLSPTLFIKPAITLVLLTIYAVCVKATQINEFLLAVVIFAANTLLYLLSDKLTAFFTIRFHNGIGNANDPILQNITLQFIKELYLPIVICSDNGRIIYCNDSLAALLPKTAQSVPRNIEEICSARIDDIASSVDSGGIEATAFDREYNITGYKIEAQNSPYYITIWNERTELARLNKRLHDEQTVIAYIIIDNLDELSQEVHEKTREATHQVELTLKSWANEVGGIIKEYERNKYLFIFEYLYLDKFLEDKFKIREKIHDIKVGETNLSLTISIGAARFGGTLAQREAGAQSALEFALKRGGDTAVYNNGSENFPFDGRVKTTSKSTQVRARMTAAKICELINDSSNILIMGHKSPDYDSIGACIGMARLAFSLGKSPKIVLNRDNINAKLCIDKLPDSSEYENLFIDASDAQDLVRSDSLAIIVDVNNPFRFESLDIATNTGKLIIIDHHSKQHVKDAPSITPEIEYIEPYASSASELVAEFLEHTLTSGTLPPKEALLLLAGIVLDTKQFTRNTGVRTFSAGQYLRSEGAIPSDAQALFENNLDEYKRSAVCAAEAKIYREHFAIAAMRASTNPDDKITAAKVADILLDLKGVHASFAVFEINNVIHISARSAGKINVASIIEGVGGGGYYESAGAQIKDATLDETLIALKEQIDMYVDSTTSS
ncbi:MAG: DHH family phosphoesterase [Clostridia bacterium]|nr:DHH family phosphoesterase [Clostridia bacterium]